MCCSLLIEVDHELFVYLKGKSDFCRTTDCHFSTLYDFNDKLLLNVYPSVT